MFRARRQNAYFEASVDGSLTREAPALARNPSLYHDRTEVTRAGSFGALTTLVTLAAKSHPCFAASRIGVLLE